MVVASGTKAVGMAVGPLPPLNCQPEPVAQGTVDQWTLLSEDVGLITLYPDIIIARNHACAGFR